MRFKPYPKYKPSGVERLGDVPEYWETNPCRAIVTSVVDKNDGGLNQNYLSLMANIGVIPYEEKGDIGNKKPEDLSKCKIVRKGNLVINSMNYAIGSYGMSPYDGVCSSVYIVLHINEDVVHPRFALRIFEDKTLQKHLAAFGNGILEHRAAIGWDDIKSVHVALPNKEEQSAILTFLDRETAKIDTLISKQEKLIELLKEKRQAVISHAVTKGLNPNMKMKDSGIEWLGDVPEHWEVRRYKTFINIEQGFAFRSEDYVDSSGVASFRMGNIKKGGDVDLSHNLKFLPGDFLPKYSQYLLNNGDTLISMTDMSPSLEFLAVPVVFNESLSEYSFLLNQRVARLHIKSMKKSFLRYSLLSDFLKYQLKLCGLGTVQSNMSSANLYNATIIVPPTSEQDGISAYLDNHITKFNLIIEKCNQSVELLNEHRTALISAAVTGKIDVREAA